MVPPLYVKDSQGFVLLTSVLIIGVVGLAVTTSVLLLSVGNGKAVLQANQSYQASALAGTCAESALGAIKTNILYTGNGSVTVGSDSCTYSVQNLGGQNRQITVTSTVGASIKHIISTIDKVTPKINIALWQE